MNLTESTTEELQELLNAVVAIRSEKVSTENSSKIMLGKINDKRVRQIEILDMWQIQILTSIGTVALREKTLMN